MLVLIRRMWKKPNEPDKYRFHILDAEMFVNRIRSVDNQGLTFRREERKEGK